MEFFDAMKGNKTISEYWQPWITPISKQIILGWQSRINRVDNTAIGNTPVFDKTP